MLTSSVVFDVGDLEAAYDELEERYLARVEPQCRPIFEASCAIRRAYNTRDWRAWRAQYADDFVLVDHRPAGWEECNVDGFLERILGIVDLAPDFTCHPVNVVRMAPDCLLTSLRFAGTDAEGGVFEISFDMIGVFVDGRFQRNEWFEPSNRNAALARFDELVADQPVEADHANLALEAWRKGVEGMHAGDVTAILATAAEGYVYEERGRPPARFALSGEEELEEMLTRMLARGEWTIDTEVVATRGPRLSLSENTSRWVDPTGGATEYSGLRIHETDEAGMLTATIVFDPDDLDAALDELDARFSAQLDPACRPIIDASSANRRAYNARDFETMRSLLATDFVLVDHRPAGWGRLDADAYIETLRGFMPLARDVVMYSVDCGLIEPDRVFGRMVSRGTDVEGGPFEVEFDFLGYFTDGAFHRIEVFDPQRRADVLAGLRDAAPNEVVEAERDNFALAAWAKGREGMGAGDVAAILAITTADYTYEERGRPPARFVLSGQEELEEMLTLMLGGGEWTIDTDVIATRGARLVLTHNTFHRVDRSGAATEYSSLRIDETDEARMLTATVVFDSDDLDAAMDELEERYLTHVNRECLPALQVVTTGRRAYNARDWEAFRSTLADDLVLEDRRPGWFGELGRDDYVERIRALVELSADARMVISEIFRVAPHAIAGQFNIRGSDPEGGTFEIVIDVVSSLADGRFRRIEFFDPARRSEAVARFEELAAAASDDVGSGNLALQAWEDAKGSLLTGAVDPILARVADDAYYEERRATPGRFTLAGRSALAEMLTTMARNPPGSIDTEVVAMRGGRLVLTQNVFHGTDHRVAGDYESTVLRLDEVDDAGRFAATVLFEPEDIAAAFDELDERFRASLAEEHRAVFDRIVAARRAYNAHDWEAVRSLLTDDFALLDHRPGWFGTLDRDGYLERLEGLVAVAPDASIAVADIPRLSGDTAMIRWITRGTGPEGGPVEIMFDSVAAWSGNRIRRFEFFPSERRDDALARFDEMAGLEHAGAAVRTWDRVVGALRRDDVDSIVGLIGPDYRDHDHVLDVVTDREEQIRNQNFVAAGKGLSIGWDRVLDLDRVGVVRVRYRWSAGGGSGVWRESGSGESDSVMVVVLDDAGQLVETHRLADDQLHRALVLAEERHAEIASDADEAAASRRFGRMWNLVDAYNRGDWDGVREMWADDLVTVDHRPAGWGTVEGRDRYVEVLEGLAEVTRDRRWIVHDLLYRGHGALAARWSVTGTDQEGGPFEMVLLVAFAFDADGRVIRQEIFPENGSDEVLAAARGLETGDR